MKYSFGCWYLLLKILPVVLMVSVSIIISGFYFFDGFNNNLFLLVFSFFLIIFIALLGFYKKAYIENDVIYENTYLYFKKVKEQTWRLSAYKGLRIDVARGSDKKPTNFRIGDYYTIKFVNDSGASDFDIGLYHSFGARKPTVLKKIMAYAEELSQVVGIPVILSNSVKQDLNNEK